jgi:hypothetical protein
MRQTFGCETWRGAHLGEEALEAFGVRVESRRQELEGYGLAELQVVGAVDLAHSAPAQRPDDAVAGAEHGPRQEALRR